MDVRTIETCPPRLEHEGSTKVWWLVDAREMFEQTTGGHLDSVAELDLAPAAVVRFASPDAWSFWYVVGGAVLMRAGPEQGHVAPGEMVLVPPGEEQELRPVTDNAGARLLYFAVATADHVGYAAPGYRVAAGMDVRSTKGVQPEAIGEGGARVWWLARPGEFRSVSQGGHLELVDEFEVSAGGEVHPHSHPTWEFYYSLFGRASMRIGNEERVMGPGDLVVIPPDAVHSIRPIGPNAGIRCFCFAIGIRGARAYDYSHDVAAGAPR